MQIIYIIHIHIYIYIYTYIYILCIHIYILYIYIYIHLCMCSYVFYDYHYIQIQTSHLGMTARPAAWPGAGSATSASAVRTSVGRRKRRRCTNRRKPRRAAPWARRGKLQNPMENMEIEDWKMMVCWMEENDIIEVIYRHLYNNVYGGLDLLRDSGLACVSEKMILAPCRATVSNCWTVHLLARNHRIGRLRSYVRCSKEKHFGHENKL